MDMQKQIDWLTEQVIHLSQANLAETEKKAAEAKADHLQALANAVETEQRRISNEFKTVTGGKINV